MQTTNLLLSVDRSLVERGKVRNMTKSQTELHVTKG